MVFNCIKFHTGPWQMPSTTHIPSSLDQCRQFCRIRISMHFIHHEAGITWIAGRQGLARLYRLPRRRRWTERVGYLLSVFARNRVPLRFASDGYLLCKNACSSAMASAISFFVCMSSWLRFITPAWNKSQHGSMQFREKSKCYAATMNIGYSNK